MGVLKLKTPSTAGKNCEGVTSNVAKAATTVPPLVSCFPFCLLAFYTVRNYALLLDRMMCIRVSPAHIMVTREGGEQIRLLRRLQPPSPVRPSLRLSEPSPRLTSSPSSLMAASW